MEEGNLGSWRRAVEHEHRDVNHTSELKNTSQINGVTAVSTGHAVTSTEGPWVMSLQMHFSIHIAVDILLIWAHVCNAMNIKDLNVHEDFMFA